MLLVGITRATQWVYLSTVTGYEIEEIDILRQAGTNKHLYIKNSIADGVSAIHAPQPTGEDEDDSTFL